MKRTKKVVEWKPTAEPWVIDRDFSLMVSNRCVFCHGRARKWRAAFNFAVNFTAASRVVVLYIYGAVKPDNITKALDGVDHQMIVFVLPVSKDDLANWDAGEAEKKRMVGAGATKQSMQAEYDTAMLHQDIETMRAFAETRRKELDTLELGERAEEAIRAAQRMPAKVHSNFLPEKECAGDHDAFLLSGIRDLYPCGVEANAPTETGAKMLLMKKLVACTMSGQKSEAVLKCVGELDDVQISLFAPPPVGAERFLRDVQEWCERQIEDHSYFSTTDLYALIFAPPYGYYPCNYYAYLLSRVLLPFTADPFRYHVKLVGVPFADIDIAAWLQKPSGIVYLETEHQRQMRLALREIFPSEDNDRWISRDLHGEIVHAAMGYVTEHINTPLACADRRWGEVFRSDSELWCDKDFTEKYYEFLTDIPARRREVETIDHIFDGKYDAEKLSLFYKFYHVKGGAVGWVWSAEYFIERLEAYMKSDVCRECGRPFQPIDKKGTVEVAQTDDLSIIRFTKKSVIGLNKKFLGRYQERYFCIHCLCEVLETTPAELKEKEEVFKQQGCTLFL